MKAKRGDRAEKSEKIKGLTFKVRVLCRINSCSNRREG